MIIALAAPLKEVELQGAGCPREEFAAISVGAEGRGVVMVCWAGTAVAVVDCPFRGFESGDSCAEEEGFGGDVDAAAGDDSESKGTGGAAGGGMQGRRRAMTATQGLASCS